MKLTPLLAIPPTVTTTLPVVAPLGTATAMLVAFQFAGVALVPLNVTVLVPCVEPKFFPVMVTSAGAARFRGVAPAATAPAMLVAFHFAGVLSVLLIVTVLVPRVEPKFAPVMVTAVPTKPEVGFIPVMFGAAVLTVKLAPLLAIP